MKIIRDTYYKLPIFIDLVLIILIWGINYKFTVFEIKVDQESLINIIYSLIDSSVALAGFILAALTIIVTFKSNIKLKGINEATNPLELILTSNHYKKIVATFKGSILELTILFIFLYFSLSFLKTISLLQLFNLVISAMTLLSLSILRSLYLLFRILKMEK